MGPSLYDDWAESPGNNLGPQELVEGGVRRTVRLQLQLRAEDVLYQVPGAQNPSVLLQAATLYKCLGLLRDSPTRLATTNFFFCLSKVTQLDPYTQH